MNMVLAVVFLAAAAVPVLTSALPGFRQGLWRLEDTRFVDGKRTVHRSDSCTDPTPEIRATLTPTSIAMCSSAVVRKGDAFETTTLCGDLMTVITIVPKGESFYTKDIVGHAGTSRETIVARRIADCRPPAPVMPPAGTQSSGGL